MLDSLVTGLKNEYNKNHNDEMKKINLFIHDNKTNETAKKTL
jgi:hypothetical protein